MTEKLVAMMAEVPPECRPCLILMRFVSIKRVSKHRTEVTYKCPRCGTERKESR